MPNAKAGRLADRAFVEPRDRSPVTGTCPFCGRPAKRRATVRDPRSGLARKVKCCTRHYNLHLRTGLFWNIQRWLAPKDLEAARRRRARGEKVADLAREYQIPYRTMKRYLSPSRTSPRVGYPAAVTPSPHAKPTAQEKRRSTRAARNVGRS